METKLRETCRDNYSRDESPTVVHMTGVDSPGCVATYINIRLVCSAVPHVILMTSYIPRSVPGMARDHFPPRPARTRPASARGPGPARPGPPAAFNSTLSICHRAVDSRRTWSNTVGGRSAN